jgi:hypothetical protein
MQLISLTAPLFRYVRRLDANLRLNAPSDQVAPNRFGVERFKRFPLMRVSVKFDRK